MTLTSDANADQNPSQPTTFGAGGGEPYAAALLSEADVLYLRAAPAGSRPQPVRMDAGRWSAEADDTDISLLEGVSGPVLDIGCGPGRMLRAAMDVGLPAFGIDVSPTAVQVAEESGLSVLHGSIFDPIPHEGNWATALLIDGNIGIGGDPAALLARCAQLLTPNGVLLVEVNDEPERDHVYECTIEDASGRRSDTFPWADIGVAALRRRAATAGLDVDQEWQRDDRWFVRLVCR